MTLADVRSLKQWEIIEIMNALREPNPNESASESPSAPGHLVEPEQWVDLRSTKESE